MLKARVLSALVLIPPAFALLYLGGWWFTALVALFGALAAYEGFTMLRHAGYAPFTWLGISIVLILIFHGAGHPNGPDLSFVLSGLIMLSLARALVRTTPQSAIDWALTLALALYLGLLMRYGPLLRNHPLGLHWVLAALITTWITDSAAYFIGLRFGRHRLAPQLSPQKSWEGAVGGWVVGVVAGTAYLPFLVPGLTPIQAATLAAAVCTVAPIGDLAESMIKRQCGMKDSGHLIPGHGGAFDRIDSLLFVFPTVYLFATLWG